MVRARFAPSPTGALHLGSARTALFNWAYTRHEGGRFVLRIEDTDRERSTPASEAGLLEGLAWLGIEWDEGPFRQSERAERHDAVVEQLLATDRAYRCVCTREELDERRAATFETGARWAYDGRCSDLALGADCGPHTVRLRVTGQGRLEWDDLVFGPSGQDADEVGDIILRRTDGTPLFHLAVVVDDLDMEIDTVIRGADHLLNTCVHLAIYRALDEPPPRYAHVPLIVGPGGKKLSKREASVSVLDFRQRGFLPDAVRNWIVRWGWSHGDQELFSAEEITRHFTLSGVGRAPAQADEAKLEWLNQQWIKALPRDALFEALQPFLEEVAGAPVPRTPELEMLVDLLRERSRTLRELAERARFALVDAVEVDETAAAKHLRPEIAPALRDLRQRLEALPAWGDAELEKAFEATRAAHDDLPMGKLAQPVRVAVTGGPASPGIFETLRAAGRERSLARIATALDAIAATGTPGASR